VGENQFKIVVENIGGLKGKHEFLFKSGCINIVEGPNSSGKTSLILGIIALYTLDSEIISERGNLLKIEIERNKLLPDKLGVRSGIIHAEAQEAKVCLLKSPEDIQTCLIIRRPNVIYPAEIANRTYILTNVLTPRSWIVRSLESSGISTGENFIKKYLNELSSPIEKYEKAHEVLSHILSNIVTNSINDASLKTQRIKSFKKRLVELKSILDREISEERRLKDLLEKEIKKVRPEDYFKIKAKLEEINKKIKEKYEDRNKTLNYIKAKKKELKDREEQINKIEQIISEKNEMLSTLYKRLEETQKMLELSYNEEYLNSLQRKRQLLMAIKKLYEDSLEVISNSKDASCPLCGSKNLNVDLIKTKIKELSEDIDKTTREIIQIITRKEELERKIKSLESEIKRLSEKIKEDQKHLRDLREQYRIEKDQIDKYIKRAEKALDNILKEIERLKESRKALEDDLRKHEEAKRILDKLDVVRNNIENYKAKIEEVERALEEESLIEVFGIKTDIESALKFLNMMKEVLIESMKYLKDQAEKQRRMFITEFNKSIKDVLNELKLSEFEEIYIDEEYNLRVHYISDDKKIRRDLLPSALSISERTVVSLILLLALRKIYKPKNIEDSPIIIDNLFENFDDIRRSKILEYLKKKTREDNLTIIITLANDKLDGLKVKYL